MPDVGQLPLQDLFDSLGLLLTPLGVLALFLSGFLVINTISALMAQQVRQIGVMKAIGARRGQVVVLYLGAVLIYSLLALAIAIPMTALISGGITRLPGRLHQRHVPGLLIALNVLAIEISDRDSWCRCLLRLYPVMKGTGITVREALVGLRQRRHERTGWRTDRCSDACSRVCLVRCSFRCATRSGGGRVWS